MGRDRHRPLGSIARVSTGPHGLRVLVIVPAWAPLRPAEGVTAITVEPGSAFGLGDHPTTVLTLREMRDALSPDATVLDVGCGSGVLAIAAAALGAGEVAAYDIDPEAHRMTLANAERNGVRVIIGDQPGAYDVVVANIGAAVLIEPGRIEPPRRGHADLDRGRARAIPPGFRADARVAHGRERSDQREGAHP
jgi:SAM-dependent methyltransferase